MKKEIKRFVYRDLNGNPQEVFVGKDGVVSITEHPALGEGDKWYYDINWEGGDMLRVFDPLSVAYITP